MNFKKSSIDAKTFIQKRQKNIGPIKPIIPVKKKKYGKIVGFGTIIKVLLFLFLMGVAAATFGGYYIWEKYLKDLPDVNNLQNMEIAEASIIYDRQGNELYKIFEEKRTYIPYEQIGQNIVNAIVAGEDKTFFENEGVDLKRLVGAFVYYGIGTADSIKGTSTISQQLIRNTLIENEKSWERKLKEMYLSYQMNRSLSKEKILELYLNKIEYGSNAFGIEQASQTFFGKKAKDTNVLEAAILASLPKGASYYSPYNYPDRLVGYLTYVYNDHEDGSEHTIKIATKADLDANVEIANTWKNYWKGIDGKKIEDGTSKYYMCGVNREFSKSMIQTLKDGCMTVNAEDMSRFLMDIKIPYKDGFIEYTIGRKDYVMTRMLEDGYMEFSKYQSAVNSGIGFQFKPYREEINNPYFVFYVKEYLEKKYGADVVAKGGLKIYTSLDSNAQKKAEEIAEGYKSKNRTNYLADNIGMITLDNDTGNIVAMLGGYDYFETAKSGNVNAVTSRMQPGSSFKTIVYALAIDKNKIGNETPIYDLPIQFPGYTRPLNNYEGQYRGRMTVGSSLGNSRNVTAMQMFYMAGGETAIINFAKTLGITSLKEDGTYGGPLSLGTGELSPLELASAYSVFANLGNKKEISPILKIIDSKGNIIEQIQDNSGTQIMSDATAYIIAEILSNPNNKPSTWAPYLTLTNRKSATKTGTSSRQYKVNGVERVEPVNVWTAGFTPQYTTVTWVGNLDGRSIKQGADGLNVAGPVWRDFMNHLHQDKPIQDWEKPASVKTVSISRISGLLPPANFPSEYLTTGLFKNSPTDYDKSLQTIQVDALCYGKVGPNTPQSAIISGRHVQLHAIDPTNKVWEAAVQKWVREGGARSLFGNLGGSIPIVNDYFCERGETEGVINISTNIANGSVLHNGSNYLEVNYNSTYKATDLKVSIGANVLLNTKLPGNTTGTYYGNVDIPVGYYGENRLTIQVNDEYYYSNFITRNIEIGEEDTTNPVISMSNPRGNSIVIRQSENLEISGSVEDDSPIREINIYISGTKISSGLSGRTFSYNLNGNGRMSSGKYTLTIEAIDSSGNKGFRNIELEVLPTGNTETPTNPNPPEDNIPETPVEPTENSGNENSENNDGGQHEINFG